MIKQIAVLVVAFACSLIATPVRAEVPLKAYQGMGQEASARKAMTDYVTGLGKGIFWHNTALEVKSGRGLFCMPDELILDQRVILSLLDGEIRKPSSGKPHGEDELIEAILVKAFIARYPCK
jgi:hypothetical protein